MYICVDQETVKVTVPHTTVCAHRSSPLTFPVLGRQRLLDELCSFFKVNADVKVVGVAGRHAVVHDARAGVELGAGVDVHEGVPFSRVQDVGDADALQAHHVCRHKPDPDREEAKVRRGA